MEAPQNPTSSLRNDRVLPDDVIIDPTVDLDRLWRDFAIFEALHHSIPIANPFTSADLDRVVDLLAPQPGNTFLDIATGSGELVRRMSARTGAEAVGVDLSPWMIRAAATHPDTPATARWLIANGASLTERPDQHAATERPDEYGIAKHYDRVACLGASWIWHGLNGTIAALRSFVAPAGKIAIGDMHLRPDVDPAQVPRGYGHGDHDIERLLDDYGLRLVDSVTASDQAWDDYLERTGDNARAWQKAFPGPEADGFVAEQAAWVADHARDRPWRVWTVWVAELS